MSEGTNKVLSIPSFRRAFIFLSGFLIGFLTPNYIWTFVVAIRDFTSERVSGMESDWSSVIKEGEPLVFILILVRTKVKEI